MAESRLCRTPGNRRLDDVLKWRIVELIKNEQWSPRQISGRLKKEGINVSHEAIYAIIRKDESGELASHCRHRMKYRRKAAHRHETKATNIRNRVSIHERPVRVLFADVKMKGQIRPLQVALSMTTASLVRALKDKKESVIYPSFV